MAYIGNTPGVSSQRFVQRETVSGSAKSLFVVSSGYSLGYVDVFVNGVQLDESDFTATDGVSVTLAVAAAVGDVVRIIAWLPRGLSDGYLKSEADARFLNLAGGTLTGSLDITNASDPLATFYRTSSTVGAGVGRLTWDGQNASGTRASYARIQAEITANTAGAHTGNLNFYTATAGAVTEKMRLDASGNLGLGVTPSGWATAKAIQIGNRASLFSYNNTTADIGNNAYYNGSDYKYIETATATFYRQASGQHIWFNAPSGTAGNAISFTQAMTLDASGNWLLGQTSSIYSAVGRAAAEINGSLTAIYAMNIGGTNAGYIYHDGTNMSLLNYRSGALAFATNNTERARIDSSGNLLVGTTSITGGRFNLQSHSSTDTVAVVRAGSGRSFGNWYWENQAGSGVGSITWGSSSTSYNTSSDYRLKENIQPMTGALAKVAALKPCTYKWKADGSDGEGFIAHELAEVVPQCVTGEKDAVDAEGNPIYQGIDTSFLVATLTAAIQELNAKVDAQAAEIAVLKGKA